MGSSHNDSHSPWLFSYWHPHKELVLLFGLAVIRNFSILSFSEMAELEILSEKSFWHLVTFIFRPWDSSRYDLNAENDTHCARKFVPVSGLFGNLYFIIHWAGCNNAR